jgi:two-component system cell cycle sensor histidine kinase/response regulator CckA
MMMTESTPQNLKILVVDDDPAILDLFRQVLLPTKTTPIDQLKTEESEDNDTLYQPSLSFDLVTCRQGEDAVNAVKQSIEKSRPFSVAFIDIRMPPGLDGIWTTEQIRRLDGNVEILIMTGYSDAHPSDITRRVPPVHKLLYVQKPIHIQERDIVKCCVRY